MSSSEPVAELPLDTAGTQLSRAREALGKSRAEIATTTRIQERYIAAFDESRYDDLPPRTYALGFARSYARAVGLDGNAIAAELRSELDDLPTGPTPAPTPAFTPGDPARAPSAHFAKLTAVVLAVVAGGVVLWHSYFQPSGSLPSLLPPATSSASVPSAVAGHPAAVTTPAANAGQAVVFTSQADGVWVKFYDGAGNQLMQKQMAKGESYTVPANAANPMLWTGRPEALSITIGGKPQAPLSATQKTMKGVAVTAAALLTRGAPSAGPAMQGAAAATVPAAHSAPAERAVTHHHTSVSHHLPAADGPTSTPASAPSPAATPAAPAPVAAKASTVSP